MPWQWLLFLSILFSIVSCGSGPNRVETLKHKKEILTARKDKDRFFKTSPNSPLLTEQQMNFKELSYFPVDITFRVTAHYQRLSKPIEFTIHTSTGHERIYTTIGKLDFSLAGKPFTLFAYQEKDSGEVAGEKSLFVPFTDQTTGHESYGAGRYLDMKEPAGDSIELDFNMAYNPYCAYNYNFSCPIPPSENRLDIAIKAGEKIFPLGQPINP
ncbi:MAG: DUF1684 domain-containing protein [Desulfobulbaceae bacterium]|nr:DUF1684 domain-containing protein [Desulfobulbaceae bacterium]